MRKAGGPASEDQHDENHRRRVDPAHHSVPHQRRAAVDRGTARRGLNILLLRLETDEGVTGWGEAFGHGVSPATKTAFDTLVAPMLIGRDPSDIDALMHDLQQTLHLFGRSGP